MTQAIVVESFGAPEVMQVAEKSLPPVGEGEVLVRVCASGVNPSDTYVRLGPAGPYAGNAALIPSLPYTPHKDGAGVVEAVGAGVDAVRVGDRVYLTATVTGSCAKHAVCKAASVCPLPENVSFSQGACVGVPYYTAYHALVHRASVRSGETILVHGASGGVGLAAVQIAKLLGCVVVGTAGSQAGEAAVKAAGADHVVNHRSEGYAKSLKECCMAGFDVVLEMAAHANLPTVLSLVKKRGRVCLVGSKAEAVGVNPRVILTNEIDVRGVFLGNMQPDERLAARQAIFEALGSGALIPVVALELPLAEAGKAHTEVMQPSSGGHAGNIVILPWPADAGSS